MYIFLHIGKLLVGYVKQYNILFVVYVASGKDDSFRCSASR